MKLIQSINKSSLCASLRKIFANFAFNNLNAEIRKDYFQITNVSK